jgi:hypothetical protein
MTELLFQFPTNELMKLEEGKPITTSTLIDYDYYFYYDCSQMKKGDKLFIQIPNKSSPPILYYLELPSNDYNYVYNKRSSYLYNYCKQNIIQKGESSSIFYNCGEFTNYNAVLFKIKLEKGNPVSDYKINIVSRKDIINSKDLFENYKYEEAGFYLFHLDELSKYNKNILIYTNEIGAMNIYSHNYDFSHEGYYYSGYRNYSDMKLFFIDPSNPETERINSNIVTKYYTILL